MTCTSYVPIRILNVNLRHPARIKDFKQAPFAGEMVQYNIIQEYVLSSS